MLGAIALLAVSLRALVAAPVLDGDLAIHDPSTVVKCDDQWWVL
jgi:hypothetical protein